MRTPTGQMSPPPPVSHSPLAVMVVTSRGFVSPLVSIMTTVPTMDGDPGTKESLTLRPCSANSFW